MDAPDAMLLQEINPRVLGDRLRAARLAREWTQTEMAADIVSVGYVSRLESGQRRPNAVVLEALASRLGIAIDELLRGPTAREQDSIKLTLDFAELALENGDHVEAESQAREAGRRAVVGTYTQLHGRARFLTARALEAQGQVDDAILELEPLVEERAASVGRTSEVLSYLEAAILLSRCYRTSGDLGLAVETGERALAVLKDVDLEGSDEGVQLACSLAAAYYERGDTGRAVRTCRIAIDQAEQLGSPKARASAYWNASVMEAERGSVLEAIPLAERALALLAEGRDGRSLARLRTALGDMQLQLDPPDVSEAQRQLELADQELQANSAGLHDIATNDVVRAKAHLYAGEVDQAHALSERAFAAVGGSDSPLLAADARAIQGQAAMAVGDIEGARSQFRQAVLLLTGMGADRDAATLWFDLAHLLEAIGDLEGSRDAYRSAAASTGLRSRPAIPDRIRAAID